MRICKIDVTETVWGKGGPGTNVGFAGPVDVLSAAGTTTLSIADTASNSSCFAPSGTGSEIYTPCNTLQNALCAASYLLPPVVQENAQTLIVSTGEVCRQAIDNVRATDPVNREIGLQSSVVDTSSSASACTTGSVVTSSSSWSASNYTASPSDSSSASNSCSASSYSSSTSSTSSSSSSD
jgi:hypothetical protein